METKRFTLGAVLSVTTHRLLTDIGDLYGILGWMTDDAPMTHQLPRFNAECEPWLLRWFPQLAEANQSLNILDMKIRELGGEGRRVLANESGNQRLEAVLRRAANPALRPRAEEPLR